MATKQEYSPLADNAKAYEEEVVRREYIPDVQRHRRLPLILTFVLGLLLGIGGACITPPLMSKIFGVADRESSATRIPVSEGDKDIKSPDGLDLGKLEFLDIPLSNDPVCGSNRHEAKAAGCHYDVLATRWYNDDCYYPDVMQEFWDEVGYELFYEDPEFTKPVSNEVAASGDWDLLWPVHDYHIMHCLYQFRRFHRAILEHRAIDDDVFSYAHTLHCTRMIMNWPNEVKWGKNTTTIIDSRVSYCMPGTAVSQGKYSASSEY